MDPMPNRRTAKLRDAFIVHADNQTHELLLVDVDEQYLSPHPHELGSLPEQMEADRPM